MKKKYKKYILILFFLGLYTFSFAQDTVEVTYYFKTNVGNETSYGEVIKAKDLTVSTEKFPYNSILRLTNIKTSKSIDVRVIETLKKGIMPEYILSNYAATQIGAINKDFIPLNVKLEVLRLGSGELKKDEKLEDFYNYEEEDEQPHGLFRITEVKEDGWGVQLASYNQINGLLEALEGIEKSANRNNILMYFNKDAKEGEAKYKLIAGPFKSKAHAQGYKEAMLDVFEDMLVILFSDL